jgi:hypothetical protein
MLQLAPIRGRHDGPTPRPRFALLARLSRIGVYPTTLVLVAAQAVLMPWLVATHRARLPLDPLGLVGLALSFASGAVLIRLIHQLCQRRRVLLVALNAVVVLAYALLYAVHVDTRSTCDFALVHANFHEIFFSESAGLIFAAPALTAVGVAVGLSVAMIVLELRVRLLSRWERPAAHRPRSLGYAVACCVLAVWPPTSHDELFAFTRSIGAYYLHADDIAGPDSPGRNHRLAWAELMRRAYACEVLVCPRCGGPMRLIAVVQEPAVCERILKHVGLWQRGPPPERRVELDPTACA